MSDRPLKPILGGTFDPVHNGHLRCALEIAEWTGAGVHVLPSGDPAHRDRPGASAAQRWCMLELACAAYPQLLADDRELRREGPTYSVDTLARWRREDADSALCFIVGADAFSGLPGWKRWRALRELTHFIVVTRPGQPDSVSAMPAGELRDWCEEALAGDLAELRRRPGGRVIYRPITPLDISATAVRALLRRGRDPGFLVPDPVRNYLLAEEIYRDANS